MTTRTIDSERRRYYGSYMSQLEKRAESLRERQNSLRTELHRVLAEAGAHLLKKPAKAESEHLTAIREPDQQVSEQMIALEAKRKRITEIEEKLQSVKTRTSELQSEIRGLSEDMNPIYEEIGTIAFDVYRGNPLVDQEYADIFSPLVEINSEISGIDAAIAEQQALLEAKPFLEKMVIRGRIALLKNRRVTREGAFRRLVRSAGHDIMGTSFVEEIGDPTLTRAAEPYLERVAATREREEEIESLAEMRRSWQEQLEKATEGKRPGKQIDELNEDLDILTQTQTSIRAELAQAVRSVPDAEIPAKAKELLAAADSIDSRLSEITRMVSRVQAALDAERIEGDLKELARQVAQKESRQAELKKEITELKSEIKDAEQRLADATATRGSVEELLEDDLPDEP